ncbi:MAG: CvpA family protein [Crocinitomicaceae bacterium]
MNFIDIIFIALFTYAAWRGFKKGFIIELFTFLALFVALYAGIHFSSVVTNILKNILNFSSDYLPTISFAIVFLVVGAMVYFGGKALEKVVSVVQLSLANKLLGAFFSMLKITFFFGGMILLVESFDEKEDIISGEAKNESLIYYPVRKIITTCIPAFEESTLFLKETLRDGLGGALPEDILNFHKFDK